LHLKEMSERLAARGHQVTVFTVNSAKEPDLSSGEFGKLPDREVINGVRVRRFRSDFGLSCRLFETWKRMKGGYRSLSLALGVDGLEWMARSPRTLSMAPAIVAHRADVVATMNWYWPQAYLGHMAARLSRLQLIGIPLFHTAESWSNASIYTRMLDRCAAVLVNTSHEAEFVESRSSARAEPVGVGIDPARFQQRNGALFRSKYGLGRDPAVGFVGRQSAAKGMKVLLEAMPAVWEAKPEVKLVLAGPREHRQAEVQAAIEAFDSDRKRRVVEIDRFAESDKASLYEALDVLAVPSVAESFGICYLEAWMCGRPVIGARIGSTECVIEDGIDGLLVTPGSASELAAAILELLSNSARRAEMGRIGRAKTLSRHTWDKVVDRVEKIYGEVQCTPIRGRTPAFRTRQATR
jgi:glycosyltransferase involved in cell wall biosynthesis